MQLVTSKKKQFLTTDAQENSTSRLSSTQIYSVCTPHHEQNSPRNKHIRHILILTKQRQMQQDFNRFRIRRHDNDFGDATVECLGGLVGTLFGLLVVGGLLDEIEEG